MKKDDAVLRRPFCYRFIFIQELSYLFGIAALCAGTTYHIVCSLVIYVSAREANIDVINSRLVGVGYACPFMSSEGFRKFMSASAAAVSVAHGAADDVIVIVPERRIQIIIPGFDLSAACALIFVITIVFACRVTVINEVPVMSQCGNIIIYTTKMASGACIRFRSRSSTGWSTSTVA